LFIAAAGADICYLELVAHPFSALIGTLVEALMCGDIPECRKLKRSFPLQTDSQGTQGSVMCTLQMLLVTM
jgi:hypothetical protein